MAPRVTTCSRSRAQAQALSSAVPSPLVTQQPITVIPEADNPAVTTSTIESTPSPLETEPTNPAAQELAAAATLQHQVGVQAQITTPVLQQQQYQPPPPAIVPPPAQPIQNQMALVDLPARTEQLVPTFDDTQPEELERYFANLQVLLNWYNIMDQHECKEAVLKYLKIRTEQL